MKASIICRRWLATLLLGSISAGSPGNEETGGWRPSGSFIPPEPWKETTVELPAWPDDAKLLEVRVDKAMFPFDVYLDPDSLSVGSDHVVRYTLVVVSSSGARNMSFEGIRCDTREYRRYAYGSGGKWLQVNDDAWKQVLDAGMDGYRHVLYRDYMCDPTGYDLQVSEILERIRYSRGSYFEE